MMTRYIRLSFRRAAALLPTLTLAAGLAASDAAAQAGAASEAGRLVIIGGGLSRDNEDVYRAILDGRRGDGPFCIVPTAGATPETAMDGPIGNFDRWGGDGTARGVLVSSQTPEHAHDPAVVAQIRACSGFFFIGGVQSRIIEAFRPAGNGTPAYDALMQRWREGAVISGSSAGAAMMSDPMIAGGSSPGAISHGVRRTGDDSDDERRPGVVSVTPGLGFFPGGIVDQHFLARGRIGRLLVAVLELQEFDHGFGIDENTALVVDGGRVTTSGASGVVIVDGSQARRSGRGGTGIRIHLMGVGDSYDIASRRFTIAEDKTALPQHGRTIPAPEDLFQRWTFLHLLHEFGGSSQTELVVPISGGEVILRKDPGFAARSRAGEGIEGTPDALSLTGITIDLNIATDQETGA
jgi:cyanophycinase